MESILVVGAMGLLIALSTLIYERYFERRNK
jgi:hypothetical protein